MTNITTFVCTTAEKRFSSAMWKTIWCHRWVLLSYECSNNVYRTNSAVLTFWVVFGHASQRTDRFGWLFWLSNQIDRSVIGIFAANINYDLQLAHRRPLLTVYRSMDELQWCLPCVLPRDGIIFVVGCWTSKARVVTAKHIRLLNDPGNYCCLIKCCFLSTGFNRDDWISFKNKCGALKLELKSNKRPRSN